MNDTVKRLSAQAGLDGAGGSLPAAERAYLAIHDMLVSLEIRPGAPINEDRLTRQLGIGRTPVREALKRLETERLVVIYPRRGSFATDIHIASPAGSGACWPIGSPAWPSMWASTPRCSRRSSTEILTAQRRSSISMFGTSSERFSP